MAVLVQRVARGERQALASLYEVLAPEVLDTIRRRLSDAVESTCVLRATFVEVWWTARYHTAAGAARGWVTGVAAQRTIERMRSQPDAVCRHSSMTDISKIYDAHTELELRRLLRPDSPVTVENPLWM
ncbi:MAG TPA: hypothetical protein VFY84_21180 [Jiangellales bacterium]|nr:hypothetical protein [Jiangellales bacterium]